MALDSSGFNPNAPFLSFLKTTAFVARKLVPLTQHLARAELTQAGRD